MNNINTEEDLDLERQNLSKNNQDESIESEDLNDTLFSDDEEKPSLLKEKFNSFINTYKKRIIIWMISFFLLLFLFVYYFFFWPIKWSWVIVEKTNNLPVFNEVVLNANVNLHFIQDKWWAKIVWDDNIIDKITFEVKWSTLEIWKKWLKNIKPSKDLDVYIYTLNINSIVINWMWKVTSDWKTIQSSDLKIVTYWSSLINMKLDVNNLHSIVHWSSTLYYHGKANNHKIDIYWSAVLNWSRFITKETQIWITWSGVCDIFAWMKLSIEISWVWQILYDWNPPEYKQKISWLWIIEKNSN